MVVESRDWRSSKADEEEKTRGEATLANKQRGGKVEENFNKRKGKKNMKVDLARNSPG